MLKKEYKLPNRYGKKVTLTWVKDTTYQLNHNSIIHQYGEGMVDPTGGPFLTEGYTLDDYPNVYILSIDLNTIVLAEFSGEIISYGHNDDPFAEWFRKVSSLTGTLQPVEFGHAWGFESEAHIHMLPTNVLKYTKAWETLGCPLEGKCDRTLFAENESYRQTMNRECSRLDVTQVVVTVGTRTVQVIENSIRVLLNAQEDHRAERGVWKTWTKNPNTRLHEVSDRDQLNQIAAKATEMGTPVSVFDGCAVVGPDYVARIAPIVYVGGFK
jgi:hypothetical protein